MQKKLKTIQKHDSLNEVWVTGEPGPGGAYHDYIVVADKEIKYDFAEPAKEIILRIEFQKGPRKEKESRRGVIDSDLLEIVRDRLKAFQSGPMASEYNAQALLHIEKALKLMSHRAEDRKQRNVLGTMKK